MYRRRFGRRRSYRRRTPYKRHVFGKKATRAIKAISQRPVETKHYIWCDDLLADIPPATWPSSPGVAYVFYRNVLDPIPRSNSVGNATRSEVVGQKFILRGISIKWAMNYFEPIAGVPSGQAPQSIRVRVTLLAATEYFNQPPFGTYSATGPFFENEDTNIATVKEFNMDKVKIIKSRTFTLSAGTGRQTMTGKIWAPIHRIVTIDGDEGTVTNSTVNRVKGWQYYCVVETYNTRPYTWTPPGDFFSFTTKVYWKDA